MDTPRWRTEGHRLLAEFIESRRHEGLTKRAVAKALGVDPAAVTLWTQETPEAATPEVGLRRALEKYTNGAVPAKSWETPEERALLERVRPFEPAAKPETKEAA